MASSIAFFVGLVCGGAGGVLAAAAWFRPRLTAAAREIGAARDQRDDAVVAQLRLTELKSQLSLLRHDLHGILSPALLSADRLTSSADPGIKRAGDIIVRTVERATARLAATKDGP